MPSGSSHSRKVSFKVLTDRYNEGKRDFSDVTLEASKALTFEQFQRAREWGVTNLEKIPVELTVEQIGQIETEGTPCLHFYIDADVRVFYNVDLPPDFDLEGVPLKDVKFRSYTSILMTAVQAEDFDECHLREHSHEKKITIKGALTEGFCKKFSKRFHFFAPLDQEQFDFLLALADEASKLFNLELVKFQPEVVVSSEMHRVLSNKFDMGSYLKFCENMALAVPTELAKKIVLDGQGFSRQYTVKVSSDILCKLEDKEVRNAFCRYQKECENQSGKIKDFYVFWNVDDVAMRSIYVVETVITAIVSGKSRGDHVLTSKKYALNALLNDKTISLEVANIVGKHCDSFNIGNIELYKDILIASLKCSGYVGWIRFDGELFFRVQALKEHLDKSTHFPLVDPLVLFIKAFLELDPKVDCRDEPKIEDYPGSDASAASNMTFFKEPDFKRGEVEMPDLSESKLAP